ncbi:MAG: Appr-p processing protein [Chlorobi bacterium]|nr:Appr-p processing protein [Chlorobiota bacterium]
MTNLIIRFCVLDGEMVSELEKYFGEFENVEIIYGDILRSTADAIVSPANSFGYMDGGIDLVYTQHFGWDLEKRLRKLLVEKHDGELPVGQAVIVETLDPRIPYLISAPTMRVPSNIENTVNVYWAFRAVLRAVREHNAEFPGTINSILCPALGTGEGRMPYARCAWQMYYAYAVCVLGRVELMGGLARAVENHIDLLK